MSNNEWDEGRQLYHSILTRLQHISDNQSVYADIEVQMKKMRLELTLKKFKENLIILFEDYQFPDGMFKDKTPKQFIKECIKDIEKINKKPKKVGFDPLSNVETFYEERPFFFDKSKMFWMWDSELCKYDIVDEIDIMNRIEESLGLYGQTISAKIKNEYLEAFKRIGRKNIPKEPPKKWIQFKDKAISLKSGKTYDVTPDYFFTNPLPWSLGDSTETPVMDKLFEEWVGKNYVKDLYEIIAYSCYKDYPIQILICLYGTGRNGKSQYLKMVNKFIGIENICSTELDLIAGHNSSRFEIFKLYKKLACMLGETNFGILSSTSILKKLVGGDVIGFEKKGKDPFDDYNYAKIIIASNSLPSSEDSSDGFMRRWHIIDFPNEFKEGKDIIGSIPDKEYNNLALKVTKILPKLLEKGSFNNQGSIEHRKERYMMASNPLPIFIKERCKKSIDSYELYNKLYTEYVKYLNQHKKRRVKMKEFKSSLQDEGFYIEKTNKKLDNGDYKSGYFVMGLKFYDNYDNLDNNPTPNPICKNKYKIGHNYHNYHTDSEKTKPVEEKVYQNFNYSDFKNIINEKLSKVPQEIEVFYKNNFENLIKIEVFDEYLDKIKKEGLIYEPTNGYIAKLE